jgi:hypothetical protein
VPEGVALLGVLRRMLLVEAGRRPPRKACWTMQSRAAAPWCGACPSADRSSCAQSKVAS